MRKFITNNGVVLVIGIALVGSLIMAVRNHFIIKENDALLKQSELIKQRTQEILSRTMHGLDLGVRGFSLTKDENMLIPYREAVEKNAETFKELEAILTAQNYPHLAQLEVVKNEIDSYIAYCQQMIEMAKSDPDQLVSMLREDKGYGVWKKYDEFSRPLFEFEDELHQTALSNYNAAVRNNLILQISIVLLGLPALYIFISRIHRERNARKGLLKNMEENDRSFVFNPGTQAIATEDEIIHGSIRNVRQASDFIRRIADGQYDVNWDGLADKNAKLNNDTLAGNLIHLRDQLKKMKQSDDQRNWVNEGLAQFSEMVRNYQSRPEQLPDQCVSFFAKYLKAQQCSLFVLEGEDHSQHLKLAACYAFERKKFVNKVIEIGNGLVGQAFLEGEIVHMKKIPEGYIKITSGLGGATPGYLVIAPLKYDQRTVAVVEIASFHQFENYQLDFLKKAGEFLASAILNTQNTHKMASLLEQAKITEESMRQREEEMRQNMEELQATQEELVRKEREMQARLAEATRS
ncbi:MAG: CHASE3 domain-containing protein [Bacteroidota bacterium]